MNRRSFFSRTIGAALAGFVAPLVGPPLVRKLVYDKRRRTIIPIIYRRINPAWAALGPERNIHFLSANFQSDTHFLRDAPDSPRYELPQV